MKEETVELSDTEEVKVMHPCYEQVPRLKEIWYEAFPEDIESRYCDFFFEHYFSPENSLILWSPEDIKSVAYMFPAYYPDAEGQKQKALYLYATATDSRYRKKHNFKKLMTSLLEETSRQDYCVLFLLGTEDVIPTYDRWHWARTAPMYVYEAVMQNPEHTISDLQICEYDTFVPLREKFLTQTGNAMHWTEESNRYMYQDVFVNGCVLAFQQNTFYAVCTKETDGIIIRETNAPPEMWQLLCEGVLNYFKTSGHITIYHYQKVPVEGFCCSQIYYGHYILLKPFSGSEKLHSVYINLVAD